MKNIRLFAAVFAMFAMAFALTACEKDNLQDAVEKDLSQLYSGSRSAVVRYCGTPATTDFMAGQHIPAGSVIVGNDETNLYVTFVTVDGWVMKATHLYVGDGSNLTNKGGSAAPGQFPYKATHSPSVTSYTYSIPLSDVPACSVIAAHAEVEEWLGGIMVDSQTAWGYGEKIGKSWAMKFEYCKQECIEFDDPGEVCYQEETAWVYGPRFVEKGNWATYTPFEGEEIIVDIFAGQNIFAGTATLSPNEDKVNLAIELVDGWMLKFEDAEGNPYNEPVKIQDYAEAPSGNPAPGQFKAYKGTALEVELPAAAFYGIHLDVVKEVPCEEEVIE